MNALLKPIYPSKGEAESWWTYLQRTLWDSAIVPEPAGGVGKAAVEAAAATQIATAARTRRPSRDLAVARDAATQIAAVAQTRRSSKDLAVAREAATLISATVETQQCREDLAASRQPRSTSTSTDTDTDTDTDTEDGDGSDDVGIACRILTKVTGSTVDPSTKYESLGLTSMQIVQFLDQLSEGLGVEGISMEALMIAEGTVKDVIEELEVGSPTSKDSSRTKTPLQLSVEYNRRFCSDPTNPYFDRAAYLGHAVLSPFVWQTAAILLNIALISASALPPALLFDYTMRAEWIPLHPWKVLGSGAGLTMLFVGVGWMIVYSAVVIAVKWLVIGRYRPSAHVYDSPGYIRWWFVESCVRVWEALIGGYLVNTPYLGIFYLGMGAHLPRRMVLSGGVRCFVRGFDLVRCGSGVSLLTSNLVCHLHTASLLSNHGVWLGPIEIYTPFVMTDVPHTLYPGFKEKLPSEPRSLPPIAWLDVIQRWLAPGLYLGCIIGLQLLANELDVNLLMIVDVFDETDGSAARQALLVYLGALMMFLIIMCLGTAISHVFGMLGDYLCSTASTYLETFFLFLTPITTIRAWLFGAHLRPLRTYMNVALAPSTARRLFIGDGTAMASPNLCPGQLHITIGRGCFLGIDCTVEEGAVLGDGVVVDTFAVIKAGSKVPSHTYISPDGTWMPLGSDAHQNVEQTRDVCVGSDISFTTCAVLIFLLRCLLVSLGDLASLASVVLLVRATTVAGEPLMYAYPADGAILWEVPALVAAGILIAVWINLAWLVLVERCAYATGVVELIPGLVMPCAMRQKMFHTLIDGSWLYVLLQKMRGAKIASLRTTQICDCYIFDACWQRWDEQVVVQGANLNGHRGKPSNAHAHSKFGVAFESGPVHLAAKTIVHPGGRFFNDFSTPPCAVVQSEGTNLRSRTHVHLHNPGTEMVV